MNVILDGFYTAKNGLDKARYIVDGTVEELAAYTLAQGKFIANHADGRPLHFTDSPKFGEESEVKMTPKGNLYKEQTIEEGLASLVEQRKIRTAVVYGTQLSKRPAAQVVAPTPVVPVAEVVQPTVGA